MKISFKEIAEMLSRVTGISTPIAGISWEPSKSEIEVARNLIIFLENRRVLYEDFIHEDSHHVEISIIEIRDELTKLLQNLGGPSLSRLMWLSYESKGFPPSKSRLFNNIEGMRRAFIEFNRTVESMKASHSHIRILESDREFWNAESKEYFKTLGKLRETVGFHLGCIAIEYGVDVDENLAAILPKQMSAELYRKISDVHIRKITY